MKKAKFTIKCPQCRNRVNVSEVSCIIGHKNKDSNSTMENSFSNSLSIEQENITIKGSYGTKIEAIIRKLLSIKKLDPKAKSLVFSEWVVVLEIISEALKENGIAYVKMEGGKHFQRNIEQFKVDEQTHVLLLPNKLGANGLNLVEASYVLLVEPSLRVGVEEQAINRIHRLGQTKSTKVFRFVIKNTIEEKIHILGKRRYASEVQELRKQEGFLSIDELRTLFDQQDEDGLNITSDNIVVLSSDSTNSQTLEETKKENFWGGSIFYNNAMVPRHRAVVQMECLHSWELKDNGKSIADEPHIDLFGRTVPIVVAGWILNLSSGHSDEEPKLLEAILQMKEKLNAILQSFSGPKENKTSNAKEETLINFSMEEN